ncbi:MAG: rRNA pseudouridine synthase [Tissierellia bacterium]|nr:rRNA pseudouridine synthase [Tissierellia bacterium]
MRINRYLAACGLCSRRNADKIISSGMVKINGTVVKDFSYCVNKEDTVIVNGETVSLPEKYVYYAFNKPVGVVTTLKDKYADIHIGHYIEKLPHRVFPVGRLDKDTSGLLILTNDGYLGNKLTHPKYELKKIYHVTASGRLSKQDIIALSNGVDIGGYITKPSILFDVIYYKDSTSFKMEISEGKNRQIRRMLDSVKHPVISLHRESVGNVSLGELPEGEMRVISKSQIINIKDDRGKDE